MKEMKAQTKNRDPFSRIPIPKSFYHPSQQKTLTKNQRKIALSPSKESRVSPEDEAFLKGTNIYSSQTPPTREHDFGPSKFDESWPSSERPSIASTSGYDRSENMISMVSDDVKQPLFTHLDSVEGKSKTGSVLQRYVNRFRNSAPMSREERVKKAVGEDKDFWWLGKASDPTLTPTSSSTPKDEEEKRSRQFIDRSESQAYTDTFQSLSSARKRRSQLEDDLATQKLQEKADRILGQSESSMGSLEAGPAVSSDGIASSESQSSSFDEPTITPRFQFQRSELKDKRERDIPARSRAQKEDITSYKPNIKRPEDDILYQWRLQRKMDLSRHGAAELMAKNNSEVQSKLKEIQQRVLIKDMTEASRPQISTPRFTSAPNRNDDSYTHIELPSTRISQQEPEKIPKSASQTPYIASPTLSHKQQGDKENMEPHLHLMCDVLPCPHAQKYQEQFKNLYHGAESLPNGGGPQDKGTPKTQQSERTNKKVVATDVLENEQYLEAEKPQKDPKNSCDSAKVKLKSAQIQVKSDVSLNRVISPEVEADFKHSPCVGKSTESVLESVDFESSEMDMTDRDKTALSDEEIRHPKDPESFKRIPRSPTKSKVIHPKYSSSPARSSPPIRSAIGQTVKDYMFTASSSVDSMTSLLSNIADGSPDRQQTPSSRRQEQTSSREQAHESKRQQTQSSSRQGQTSGEQTASDRKQTQSSDRQQREATEKSRQQTHSSRESSRRAKSSTPIQMNGQSSKQYHDQRGSSRKQEKERDSAESQGSSSKESLARSSKDQSPWSSGDLQDSEVQDDHTRYSAEIADDEVSDEDFADDQLLKLLRQQRNDIEKKLGEIDKQLLER